MSRRIAIVPQIEAAAFVRCALCGLLGSVLLYASAAAAGEPPAAAQALSSVSFSGSTAIAGNAERVRRLLSPLSALRLERELTQSGKTLTAQVPITLADERFALYLPAQQPAKGYGLLVFVPPWQDARLPPGWSGVLDRFGIIFVSAAKSGNEENVFNRREPLALLAAGNVMARYPVDPDRVYIGGFSGGSRIALRLALGYPDVFRGALLNAGSDPIGDRDTPLPPGELFERFLTSTRIVYVTGERDVEHATDDALSLRSLHQWCMFSTDSQTEFRTEHTVAAGAALARALGYLQEERPPDAARLAACRSGIEAELAAKLKNTEALISVGRHAEAERALHAIDERFGGLAAPRSLELAARLQ
jgi:pimeloyl-ACP methyl ester carboxylesterase